MRGLKLGLEPTLSPVATCAWCGAEYQAWPSPPFCKNQIKDIDHDDALIECGGTLEAVHA